ncbi:MAG: hypothetical protein AAGD18_22180 [Actinomycetota bacterium]
MLGYDHLDRALVRRPAELVDVDDETWSRLADAADGPGMRPVAQAAWRNGQVFLEAADALRGRRPLRIEWKGGHRAPGPTPVPVDLRVDHVFLVSCKYASRILLNSAPARLFDGAAEAGRDWYVEVARDETQALYEVARAELAADVELPPFVGDLAAHHRKALKPVMAERDWGAAGAAAYAELAAAVGRESAARWRAALSSKRRREAELWRLLRVTDAPYFVLGTSGDHVLRVRVATPWDWRRRYDLKALEVWGAEAGQPQVGWRATVFDREAGAERPVEGHVEVRWSHGRFAQPPEAKVYLDTPHHRVPGYEPLS